MNRRDLFALAGKIGLVALAQQVPWSVLERLGLVGEYLAEAAALPQNYLINSGTVLASGNNGMAAVASSASSLGAGATSAVDNTDPAYIKTAGNTKSIKLSIDATGGQTGHNLEWAINKNFLTTHGQFGVWVGIPNASAMSNKPQTRLLVSSAPFTKHMSNTITYVDQYDTLWNFVCWHRDSMANTGSESWANTMTRIRLQMIMQTGFSGDIYIDDIVYGMYSRPKVLFVFDDGYDDIMTEAYAYLAPLGLRGNVAVTTSFIGQAGRLTTANLDTLYAAGWDHLNHSVDHTSLTTFSASALTNDLSTSKAFMDAGGWTRASNQYVYPQGLYNSTVVAALRAYGYDVGWSTTAQLQHVGRGLWPERMGLARRNMDGSVSIGTLKGYVTDAIRLGGTVCFYGHEIINGVTAGKTDRAIVRALADFVAPLVAAGVLDNPTCSEWVTGLTSPRRKRTA